MTPIPSKHKNMQTIELEFRLFQFLYDRSYEQQIYSNLDWLRLKPQGKKTKQNKWSSHIMKGFQSQGHVKNGLPL